MNLDEFGLDVFIKHELWKDIELLWEELIGEVDSRVHDASAMCSDWIGNVTNVDCIEMFIVAWTLHKDLQCYSHKTCRQTDRERQSERQAHHTDMYLHKRWLFSNGLLSPNSITPLCDFHRNFPAGKLRTQIMSPTSMICVTDFHDLCPRTLLPTFPMYCNGLNSTRMTQTGLSQTCRRLCDKHLDTSRWFVSATFTETSRFHDLSPFESATFHAGKFW